MDETYEAWKAGELKAKKLPGQMSIDDFVDDAAASAHGARREPGTSRWAGHETKRVPPRGPRKKGVEVHMTFADVLGTRLTGEIEQTFQKMEWSEDEIRQACDRHGEAVGDHGPIWSSFKLMTPTVKMPSEQVYRSHCRELLERVAAGEDTRPGTGAEVVMTLSDFSLHRPLNGAGMGLMVRLFKRVVADRAPKEVDELIGETATEEQIDELERRMRSKLAQEWRTKDGGQDEGVRADQTGG
jgi:hypothetical protein